MTVIQDMDRSIAALALELPEAVHADVKARWEKVRELLGDRVGWTQVKITDGIVFLVPPDWTATPRDHYYRLGALAHLLSDLDRSIVGRHEGDVQGGAPRNISPGNPLIRTGQHIGYTMSGDHIVMPPREDRHDPDCWVVKR